MGSFNRAKVAAVVNNYGGRFGEMRELFLSRRGCQRRTEGNAVMERGKSSDRCFLVYNRSTSGTVGKIGTVGSAVHDMDRCVRCVYFSSLEGPTHV